VPKVIISGGGTGGHIFPALAIADALKRQDENIEILFVGAEGKMEMERVPIAGYDIIGLPIRGIQRRISLANLKVPFLLIKSLWMARSILHGYKPDVVIGVGGYASGPLLRMAAWMGIPTMVQEQNSYPGITNKLLAKRAKKIFVAYEGMERFFPGEKIVLSGNPIRKQAVAITDKRSEAVEYFSLDKDKSTLFFVGGSLGALVINQAVEKLLPFICKKEVQVLWQTGANSFESLDVKLKASLPSQVKMLKFIERMDLAYALADVIISRAGAMSISELCVIGKPVIFIPSPYVSEDHQTKNALALTQKDAAILLKETEALDQIEKILEDLLDNEGKRLGLAENIKALSKPTADDDIAHHVLEYIRS
jgi:UDP-N-acetylglucosamine--N-acetylmuramyl-(pentapeptide) pyrophosphoryl-undecaprenol N-acetylglucosamine transferase